MWVIRDLMLAVLLIATCQAEVSWKKTRNVRKRAVNAYSYPTPNTGFDERSKKEDSKVTIETIKSISPPEYLSSTSFLGESLSRVIPKGKIPVGSVTFNAYEADTTNKNGNSRSFNYQSHSSTQNKPKYDFFPGNLEISHGSEELPALQSDSFRRYRPGLTASVAPPYKFTQTSSILQPSGGDSSATLSENSYKFGASKNTGNKYKFQKYGKKPNKSEQKQSDSRPEETGFNGYHYGLGSFGFGSHSFGGQGGGGGGGGMMGLSYMRSSSPFYNFHVMLD